MSSNIGGYPDWASVPLPSREAAPRPSEAAINLVRFISDHSRLHWDECVRLADALRSRDENVAAPLTREEVREIAVVIDALSTRLEQHGDTEAAGIGRTVLTKLDAMLDAQKGAQTDE